MLAQTSFELDRTEGIDTSERFDSVTRIGVGGADSGIPFHAHELAMNVVFGGRKLWLVARPNDHELDNPTVASQQVAWEDLDQWTRLAWVTLGWTHGSWEGYDPPPASDDMDWAELSSDQALAAEKLGFTALTWDQAESQGFGNNGAGDFLPSEKARIWEFLGIPEGVSESSNGDGDRSVDSEVLNDWSRRESEGQAWRCTQQPGDVVFVPHGLLHTTINVDQESFAVAVQHRDHHNH